MGAQFENRIGCFFWMQKENLVEDRCGGWGIVGSTNLVSKALEGQIFGPTGFQCSEGGLWSC